VAGRSPPRYLHVVSVDGVRPRLCQAIARPQTRPPRPPQSKPATIGFRKSKAFDQRSAGRVPMQLLDRNAAVDASAKRGVSIASQVRAPRIGPSVGLARPATRSKTPHVIGKTVQPHTGQPEGLPDRSYRRSQHTEPVLRHRARHDRNPCSNGTQSGHRLVFALTRHPARLAGEMSLTGTSRRPRLAATST
jgi:hypothetical protein